MRANKSAGADGGSLVRSSLTPQQSSSPPPSQIRPQMKVRQSAPGRKVQSGYPDSSAVKDFPPKSRKPANMAGLTTQRGYGTRHQHLRKRLALEVERGAVACARCGRLIVPGTPWDLGHDDHDRSVYTGPEHRSCNRAAGAHRRVRRAGRFSAQQGASGRPALRYQVIDGERVLLPPGITRWSVKWFDVNPAEYENVG